MFSKSQGTPFVHIIHLFKLYHVLALISPLKYIFQEVKAGCDRPDTGIRLQVAWRISDLLGFFLFGSLLLLCFKKN